MTAPGDVERAPDERDTAPSAPWRRYAWLPGAAAVLIILGVSLAVWGPGMEFPTTISESRASTQGGGSVVLTETVRERTGETIDNAVDWLTEEGDWLFDGISDAVGRTLVSIEDVLKWVPWPAAIAAVALLSFVVGRWRLTAFTTLTLLYIGFMGLWENAIDTIALMVVAVAIALALGLPLGVLGARSRIADGVMRPILDAMQTMPSFVYLLPGILFFGLGKPAGIFATVIYAVPPVIRLTNLGIRQVSPQAVEAALAFGSSPWQVLTKVQIPMAMPTIMAGINQTTLMALAMVTIASMVAAGGLGDDVLRALQKNQPGNGLIAGLAIVFLAIIIDRLTQSIASEQSDRRSAG
ncbi:MAG: proline/glycine betaine ABC transporter permease [Chloroflexota bacterium]|nr:proline/glycine betaine ABC transporter permease [Chloroflexota bacterium]